MKAMESEIESGRAVMQFTEILARAAARIAKAETDRASTGRPANRAPSSGKQCSQQVGSANTAQDPAELRGKEGTIDAQ